MHLPLDRLMKNKGMRTAAASVVIGSAIIPSVGCSEPENPNIIPQEEPTTELLDPYTIYTSNGPVEFGREFKSIVFTREEQIEVEELLEVDHGIVITDPIPENRYGVVIEEDPFDDKFLEKFGQKDEANINLELLHDKEWGLVRLQLIRISLTDYSEKSFIMIKRIGDIGENDNYFLNFDFIGGFREVKVNDNGQIEVYSYLMKGAGSSVVSFNGKIRILVVDPVNQRISYNDVDTRVQ